MQLILIFLLFLTAQTIFSMDLGYFQNKSSSTESKTFSFNSKLMTQSTIGFGYSLGQDLSSTVEDKKSSQFKIAFKTKVNPAHRWGLDFKQLDDYYHFEGQSFSARYQYRFSLDSKYQDEFSDFEDKKTIKLDNKIHFKLDLINKNYTLKSHEEIKSRVITVGYEKEFDHEISLSVDLNIYKHESTTPLIKNSLQSENSTNTDIDSLTSGLIQRSWSVGFDKAWNDLNLSLSFGRDTYLWSSLSQSDSYDLSIEYQMTEKFSISGSIQKSSVNSSTPSQSTGLGLNYSF